jgi:hypothetical protein
MKNILFLIVSGLCCFKLSAQAFQLIHTGETGVNNPEMEWSDYDNDGDQDLLVCMQDDTTLNYKISIYRNDGSDQFFRWDVHSGPATTWLYSAHFEELNGDGVDDIAISYEETALGKKTIVLAGNGTGGFAAPQTILNTGGTMEFADVDQDGDQDFILGTSPSRIYLNNGNLNFAVAGTPIVSETLCEYSFGDLNGDTLPDLVSTGETSIGVYHLRVFQNNGNGNFIQMVDLGDYRGNPHIGDIDNDSDNDIVFSGISDYNSSCTRVFVNNGSFGFDTIVQTLTGVNGAGDLLDINNDGYLDYLASGYSSPQGPSYHTILYVGNGNGNFTEFVLNPIVPGLVGEIEACDYNQDGYDEFAICGQAFSSMCTVFIFKNASNNIANYPAGDFSVFPTITHDFITIKYSGIDVYSHIELKDPSGRICFDQDVSTGALHNGIQLPLVNEPPGVYIMELIGENKRYTVRVVKQ